MFAASLALCDTVEPLDTTFHVCNVSGMGLAPGQISRIYARWPCFNALCCPQCGNLETSSEIRTIIFRFSELVSRFPHWGHEHGTKNLNIIIFGLTPLCRALRVTLLVNWRELAAREIPRRKMPGNTTKSQEVHPESDPGRRGAGMMEGERDLECLPESADLSTMKQFVNNLMAESQASRAALEAERKAIHEHHLQLQMAMAAGSAGAAGGAQVVFPKPRATSLHIWNTNSVKQPAGCLHICLKSLSSKW